LLLWFRHRRPKTFMSSIDEFQREMHALGREPEAKTPYRRRSTLRHRATERSSKVEERSEGH
jgi:hypothetical protein